MRWTPEKIEELRALSHLGDMAAAKQLDATADAVHSQRSRMRRRDAGLPLWVSKPVDDDPALRARWVEMLPGMRDRVRAAVLASAG